MANPLPKKKSLTIPKTKPKSHGFVDWREAPKLWSWIETQDFSVMTVCHVVSDGYISICISLRIRNHKIMANMTTLRRAAEPPSLTLTTLKSRLCCLKQCAHPRRPVVSCHVSDPGCRWGELRGDLSILLEDVIALARRIGRGHGDSWRLPRL